MNRISHATCRGGWALGLLLAGALGAAAQDVSIAPLRWSDPKDPPDEMPVLQGTPRLDFPAAMRNTPDIGYVVVGFLLDAKGRRLGSQRASTTPAFIRVYEEAFEQFRFTPGRRDGKPVNTSVTLTLIFNPASAAVGKPDATPRLLDAATVLVPRPKGAKPGDVFEDRVIPVDVSVDETGRITAIKNEPPELAEKFEIAAKNWRFAPARQAGQPVPAELRVPFVVETAGDKMGTGKTTAPRVTFQKRPVYPFAMRASGMRGEVLVDFTVDIEGRVRNAFVIRSLNPSFDDPALEAVRKWRFEPGQMGERPVNTHMQVPIMFQLDDTAAGGSDGMERRKKPDLSKLPEELRYDTPPRLTGSARAIYPYPLLAGGREGKATIRYLVDERGRVIQAVVAEATAPEFGYALLSAVEQFTFEPAIKGGRPSKALQGFMQEFQRAEEYQVVTSDDLALLRLEQKKPGSIIGIKETDGKLTPISQRPPKYPLSQIADSKPGEAVIEFLIDEDGRARLPRIASASHEDFGYAAIQAIAAWRFEPPTRGGRAAVVRVKVPVRFVPPSAPTEINPK